MKLIDADLLKTLIDNIPGSEIQRIKAEWIRTKITCGDNRVYGYLECSRCLFRATEESNFCPYCGADMIGEKHG